jgi:long-chain acyl-CoA synthetase
MVKLYHTVNPKLFLTDSRIRDDSVKKVSLKECYAAAEALLSDHGGMNGRPAYVVPEENAIAEIIFTTGTTGNPKGAMLSYKNIVVGTIFTRDGVHRCAENIELMPLPLNHSFGLRVLRTILYVGGTAVLQNGFMFSKEMTTNIEDCGAQESLLFRLRLKNYTGALEKRSLQRYLESFSTWRSLLAR